MVEVYWNGKEKVRKENPRLDDFIKSHPNVKFIPIGTISDMEKAIKQSRATKR